MRSNKIFYTNVDFPLGQLRLACSAEGILRITFLTQEDTLMSEDDNAQEHLPIEQPLLKEEAAALMCRQARREFGDYFAAKRKEFTCPVIMQGTPFQTQVWDIVSRIPYGMTLTYGEIAEELGNKNLSRAVGLANGANPLPIIIPCHRVLGKDGNLTGYAGGLAVKRYLLQLEGAILM